MIDRSTPPGNAADTAKPDQVGVAQTLDSENIGSAIMNSVTRSRGRKNPSIGLRWSRARSPSAMGFDVHVPRHVEAGRSASDLRMRSPLPKRVASMPTISNPLLQ
jgi:hypothetical protein